MKKTALTTIGALAASCAISSATLIAHYKLDETSGTGAADSAAAGGFQNAVQDSGTVTWTTGILGGAVDINNQDLRINDSLLTGASAFSISAWVNLDTRGGYQGIFMSRGASNNGNWGFALNDIGGSSYAFDYRFDNSGGGSDGKDSPGGSATINAWHHLAMVWRNDGTGETYLNGVLGPTKTGASTVFEELSEASINWFIGSDIDRRINAQIDDIAVWDQAIVQADVLALYQNGAPTLDASQVTFVPEPGAAVLVLLGGLFGLRRRR